MEKTQSRSLQAVLCAGVMGVALCQPAVASVQTESNSGSGLKLSLAQADSAAPAGTRTGRVELAAVEKEAAFVDAWTQENEAREDGWKLSVGVAALRHARYLGSGENIAYLRPFINASWNWGPLFIDNAKGLGMGYKTDGGLSWSAALAYDPGRGEENSRYRPGSARLQGMGRIKGAPVAMLSLGQELTSWLKVNGELGYRLANRSHSGDFYRLGLEAKVFEHDRDTFRVNAKLHGGSKGFNQANLGVSASQASTSRFDRYDAKSGFYAYSVGADWHRRINKHWALTAGVEAMSFKGDFRNSPLVEKKRNLSFGTALSYTF